ncbi:MAG: hypothetical protein HOB37_05200 [Rhodospirillaceae bacterium]|nr:hypothetical protein [Rhodospirillaceae bacterium]
MTGVQDMDVFKRRAVLKGLDTPGGGADYVTGIQGQLTLTGFDHPVSIAIRYVPDRYVVTPESFQAYLETLEALTWNTLEEVAVAAAKDISNELLTRWAQANLRTGDPENDQALTHDVTIEDRQPGWRNDDLLYRLTPI